MGGRGGWFGDPASDGPEVARYAAAEDAHRAGGAWWVWRQACGDPHTLGDGGAVMAGGLNRLHCPDGAPLGRPAAFTGPLSRAAPGRLTALSASWSPRRLSLAGAAGPAGSCRLDVWVPGAARPAVAASGVAPVEAVRVPGGWRVTGCARGAYRLRVGWPPSARRAGKPPVAIGPHRSMVTRISDLPWRRIAARYSSQSGCSPAMHR